MILVRLLLVTEGRVYAREEMLPEEVVARCEAALKKFHDTHNPIMSDTNGIDVDIGYGIVHLVAIEFPVGRPEEK